MKSGTVNGDKALELIMRDVLGALSELATEVAHNPYASCMQILAIEPAPCEAAPARRPPETRVVPFKRRSAA